MRRALIDVLGSTPADAAVRALTAVHEDRVPLLERAWDSRVTAHLLPALPPGAACDPDLATVSRELLGCPVRRLPFLSAWRPPAPGRPACMVAASHSWAAVAFARAARHDPRPAHLVHIDAHDDFAPPPPGRLPPLRDPAAVAAWVVAGRFGIGSFIRPFADAGIVHTVWQVQRSSLGTPLTRTVTGPGWLDIDLDCLCNALDDRNPEPLIGEAELRTRLAAMVDHIRAAFPVRPALVTVALSPGFFPAALWRPALTGLQDLLAQRWPALRLPFTDP
ncbi:hypothetical protein ABZ860_41520 [Microbispora sp. NPDC046973]|uniref:hypothetical protein n=1 Tax=Microbispora sp. NPDC046973 TaxID=3155022 RepID=UPI0033EE1C24